MDTKPCTGLSLNHACFQILSQSDWITQGDKVKGAIKIVQGFPIFQIFTDLPTPEHRQHDLTSLEIQISYQSLCMRAWDKEPST